MLKFISIQIIYIKININSISYPFDNSCKSEKNTWKDFSNVEKLENWSCSVNGVNSKLRKHALRENVKLLRSCMISSLLFSSYKTTYIQFLPVMEMLKKSYAESLESLLLPSKNGNHFINSVENRKKKGKKGEMVS